MNPLAWLESKMRGVPLDPAAMAQGIGTAPSEGAARFGSNFLPGVGDMAGLAQDAEMYMRDPSSRTPGNALLSVAGVLPFIPPAARNYDSAKKLAESIRKNVDKVTGGMGPDISLSFRTPDVLRLDRIVVPPSQRGRGVGSAAIKEITDYADENGLYVVLNAAGDFGGSKAGQRRLYKRHGFADYKRGAGLPDGAVSMFDEGLMYRKPGVR